MSASISKSSSSSSSSTGGRLEEGGRKFIEVVLDGCWGSRFMSVFFCKAGPNLPKSFLRTDCERSNLLMGFTGTVEGTLEPTTLLEGKGLKKNKVLWKVFVFVS